MTIYELYSRPVLVRYLASWWSKATVFNIVCLCITWIVPLIIAVSSGGFWPKISTFNEQPSIRFKYQLLLVLDTTPMTSPTTSSYVTWSTYNNYNQLQMQNLRIPLLQTREDDYNGDGLNDQLTLQLSIPLTDLENVRNVQLLLVFDYVLQTYSYFEMESLLYISYSSVIPGASLNLTGNVALVQTSPLRNSGIDLTYNTSVISNSSAGDIYAQSFDISNILMTYSARNQTTSLTGANYVWMTGRGAGKPFIISTTIKYPTQYGIWYYTGFWQMIKWGWVQYVSVLLIFLFIFDRIKVFVFQHQLVTTIVLRRPPDQKN